MEDILKNDRPHRPERLKVLTFTSQMNKLGNLYNKAKKYFKLKLFGVLFSIDIDVSVKTSNSMSFSLKTNCLMHCSDVQLVKPGNDCMTTA